MDNIQCMNCKKVLQVEKIIKGTTVTCECGCIQECIDKDYYISRWRLLNPLDIEDKRELD